jgi:hypothetical protein
MSPLKTRVVDLSAGRTENLSSRQIAFLEALRKTLREEGLEIAQGSPSRDDIAARYSKFRSVDGLIVVAFSQWSAQRLNRQQDRDRILPSEFAHIMNTMAIAAEKPLFVIMERDVEARGTLRDGYVSRPSKPPRSLKPEWLQTNEFKSDFSRWLEEVKKHRHVFLGYGSEAEPVATAIFRYLTELGVDVLDWHQFSSSGFILQRIEEAARSTSCGIFLLTASDQLESATGPRKVPRDNVVFELGYFAGQKGRDRVLVVVEDGTEVPSDLGGYIVVPLPKSRDTKPIETRLAKFIEDNLQNR